MRILIVDDDLEWLGLLTRLFPGHIVDAVQSFAEALKRVETPDHHYDVAVVDLNLLSDDDRLGGDILGTLYQNSPSTLRIAVTGTPEGSMRLDVLDEYHVEDVFIKGGKLARLRQIVLGRPSPVAPDMSTDPTLEKLQAGLREKVQALKKAVLGALNQQIADQQNDLRSSGRERSGVEERHLTVELDRLRALRDAFVAECAGVEANLDAMSSTGDGRAAARATDDLTQRWKTTGQR